VDQLFDTSPLKPDETPETRVGPVARVALMAAVDGQYSYAVPEPLADRVERGKRVLVPFGRNKKPQPAFCIAMSREPWTSSLKPMADVVDDDRLLDDHLLELGEWISRYYCCPLGRALAAMAPEPVRRQSGFATIRTVRLLPAGSSEASEEKDAYKRSSKRRAVRDMLQQHPEGLELNTLIEQAQAGKSVIRGMIKAGLVEEIQSREAAPAPDFDRPIDEPTFDLDASQNDAITRIVELSQDRSFRAVLLFGVSGSGKTEVYVHAIRSLAGHDQQAILLVPEIALTTQLVDRLARRFTDVAVIHSGLTGKQRSLTYAAIARGEKKVVIGTRSAVFAPCPNLGLIVVDEEQEPSYKNQQTPRFHTRDVAIKRAQLLSIPIVLGSATPSMETWRNCERLTFFEKIVLPSRVAGLAMPEVKFVDLREDQKQRAGVQLLSEEMEQYLTQTFDAGEQAILLLNRRGYANYLVCSRCRNPVVCPNCRANMVFHQTTAKAMCHYCRARLVLPDRCGDASCGGKLTRFGMGTQRVEEELHRKFPSVRIARADSDTMHKVSDYEAVVQAFQAGETDVLLGTQMIAKGLDFPRVSFVGVVNADTSMSMPDFRAAERTFQMVTQVAGRAGRAQAGGRVVIQSLMGFTPTLQSASQHDYEGFAARELPIRQNLGWPPFTRLARCVLSHPSESQARADAQRLADAVRQHLIDANIKGDVLGPQSAPLARLRNRYRFDFLIRAANASVLLQAMEHLRHAGIFKTNSRNLVIDVDPQSLA
jgi:primosomal protein N' (replication factor Y)